MMRQKLTDKIENEILLDFSPNATLAPIFANLQIPTTLKRFRQLMTHLPVFQQNHSRNDYIYGAARYCANTIGIKIVDAYSNERLDQPMSDIETKQLWRMAMFKCRCQPECVQPQHYGSRSFCRTCSYLIFKSSDPVSQYCPACHLNESWYRFNAPCLACQLATVVYRHPFNARYSKLVDCWTSDPDSDETDETSQSEQHNNQRPTYNNAIPDSHILDNDQMLLALRRQMIESSFHEIRAKAQHSQTRIVFENLARMQENLSILSNTEAENTDK